MKDMAKTDVTGTLGAAVEGLSKKVDMMLRLMDEQLHLQRVALLEEGHILRFFAPGGQAIALSLPQAQDDYVQRMILRGRTFYEARLLAAVQAMGLVNAESIVCDVGANIGNHTVYFASVMGAAKVHAFEPQPHVFATLKANVALNALVGRTTLHNCLLGAEAGKGRQARFNPRNMGGTAFEAAGEGTIPVRMLDEVISAKARGALDLIKIDVEGMQDQVLKGAEGILDQRKPALWIEILEKDSGAADTVKYLSRFGYKGERLAPNDWLFRA